MSLKLTRSENLLCRISFVGFDLLAQDKETAWMKRLNMPAFEFPDDLTIMLLNVIVSPIVSPSV